MSPKQLFRNCFIDAANSAGVSPTKFGLRDFLNDGFPSDDNRLVVIARCALHFCVDDSTFNNNMVGLAACVAFSKEYLAAELSVQSLHDLNTVLNDNPDTESLVDWAQGAFGKSG